jgi:hypothetical protein
MIKKSMINDKKPLNKQKPATRSGPTGSVSRSGPTGSVKKHHKPNGQSSKKSASSKKAWTQILSNPKTKSLLKNVWKSNNPQKNYDLLIHKLGSKIKQ